MAAQKLMVKRRKKGRQPPPRHPAESRAADAVTVLWMLAVMTTLLCELGAAAANWYAATNPDAAKIEALLVVLLFGAVVNGSLTLVLTPVVLKVRRVPPPRGITVFAVVVGAAPWVVLLVGALTAA